MTFYVVTFVGQVSAEGKPVASPEREAQKAVREVPCWDGRTLAEMNMAYRENGVLTIQRVGEQHSKGRPWEKRGEISIFSPWLIAISVDVKMNQKQPGGPVEYQPRQADSR